MVRFEGASHDREAIADPFTRTVRVLRSLVSEVRVSGATPPCEAASGPIKTRVRVGECYSHCPVTPWTRFLAASYRARQGTLGTLSVGPSAASQCFSALLSAYTKYLFVSSRTASPIHPVSFLDRLFIP